MAAAAGVREAGLREDAAREKAALEEHMSSEKDALRTEVDVAMEELVS